MPQKHAYALEYSEFLKKELARLKTGNAAEKQRFRNAETAIAKIQSNPLNKDFNKDLPDNYKAADVLQQYRLFFRIENIDENTTVIFLAWMNDDSCLHASGEADDAYNVFRGMLAKDEIETYVHKKIEEGQEKFSQHNAWGENVIYCDLQCSIKGVDEFAASYLFLNRINQKEYSIESISVSHTELKLAQKILSYICIGAFQNGYRLFYELNSNLNDADKNRHILLKHGFSLDEVIDEAEIWVK